MVTIKDFRKEPLIYCDNPYISHGKIQLLLSRCSRTDKLLFIVQLNKILGTSYLNGEIQCDYFRYRSLIDIYRILIGHGFRPYDINKYFSDFIFNNISVTYCSEVERAVTNTIISHTKAEKLYDTFKDRLPRITDILNKEYLKYKAYGDPHKYLRNRFIEMFEIVLPLMDINFIKSMSMSFNNIDTGTEFTNEEDDGITLTLGELIEEDIEFKGEPDLTEEMNIASYLEKDSNYLNLEVDGYKELILDLMDLNFEFIFDKDWLNQGEKNV